MPTLKVGDIVVQTRNDGVWWMRGLKSDAQLNGVCVIPPAKSTAGTFYVGGTNLFNIHGGGPASSTIVVIGHSETKPEDLDHDACIVAARLLGGAHA